MNDKEYQEKRYGKEAPLFFIREATAAGVAVGRYGDSINIAYPESSTRRGRIGIEIAQTLLTSCEQVVICERNGAGGGVIDMTEQPEISVIGSLGTIGTTSEHNNRVHDPEGIAPTATAVAAVAGGTHHIKIFDYSRFRVRKLTPTEYGRLQGFPMDTWRQVVSNSQAYKQFGNAVTVPLAEAIGKSIIEFLDEQEAEDGTEESTEAGSTLRGLRKNILQISKPSQQP